MLNLENIGIEFSGRWLLQDASYQFTPGERIGLIGRNGTGKSTLLKVIAGQLSPTEGRVNKSSDLKIAFFNQDLLSFETDDVIFDVVKQAFAPLLKLQEEIDALLHRIEAGETDPKIWDELAQKQAAFETRGGSRIEANVGEMLSGLGFSNEEQHQPYQTFSGGWRMRVLLAKMLLEEPSVLLLDEPTNHLDLPSIQWLENYLKGFSGITIIVSHDRFFIDRMADKVLEISLKRLNEYAGNYSYYLQEKAIRHEQQLRSYENQQKYIEQQERFITRFKAKATKAKQAQSKLKQLEKIERIEAPEEEGFGFNLRFQMNQKSGKEVVRLRHINKAYGEKEILHNSEGTIMRGDKIALIGANGLGKSTLLRIVAGTEPHEGTCETGHNVTPSFFAQHQLESLEINSTILDEIGRAGSGFTETELRGILGCFMFSGDEVEKKIKVLSGGERSRVAMAKTLISHANFLLLDEPTNHLDIPSIQVLIQALNAYEGTYIIVSHDRWFLGQVANKIWFIEDKKLKEYPGTYEEYEHWKEKREAKGEEKREAGGGKREQRAENRGEGQAAEQEVEKKSGISYKERKQIQNKIKKLKRDVEKFEEEIERLEGEKGAAVMELSKPEVASDFSKISEVQAGIEALDEQILELTAQWEEALETLEVLEENEGSWGN